MISATVAEVDSAEVVRDSSLQILTGNDLLPQKFETQKDDQTADFSVSIFSVLSAFRTPR